MFWLVSQDGKEMYSLSNGIVKVSYKKTKGLEENEKSTEMHLTTYHKICVKQRIGDDGQEVARYRSEEECTKILKAIQLAIQMTTKSNTVFKMPEEEKVEETLKLYDKVERIIEKGRKIAEEEMTKAIEDFELF